VIILPLAAAAAATLTSNPAAPIMDTLTALFLAILHISWQAAVLALVILAAQHLFRRQLPARWRYALWFLVIARLLMPTLPESPLSLQRYLTAPVLPSPAPDYLIPTAPAPVAPLAPALANTPTAALVYTTPPPATFPTLTLTLLSALWLLGVATFSLSLLLTHRRFLRTLRRTQSEPSAALHHLLAECAAELRLRARPRILESTALTSPAIFGLLRPTLLLPAGFERTFTPDEQRMILLHELAHVRRGDLLVNALLTALQILHWFNPLLCLAFRRMRFDRECATDSLVLSGPRAAQRTLYGLTLLKLVERLSTSPSAPTPPRLLGILEDKKRLGERFTRIRTATPGAYGWSALGLALLFVIGLTTLTQPATAVAESPSENTNKTTGPVLPANPTPDQVNAYIEAVLKGLSPFANTSLKDPQIQQLKQVGPENIPLLIEANERAKSGLFGLDSASRNYYLSMAVCELARPQDRDLVVAALPNNRYLVYTIVKMGWAPSAREELLRVFRTEPGKFAPGWIEALASLHDPTLYPELKDYLINGHARTYTYAAIKDLPGIGDLKPTVAAAWAIAKTGNDWDLRSFAIIASAYDLPDAADYLAAHPDKTETETKAKAVTAEKSPNPTAEKSFDATRAAMRGTRLTPEAAEKLSRQISAEPDRIDIRMELLGYYFIARRSLDPAARDAAQPHILWIINNHPASPAAALPYTQVVRINDLTHYAEAKTAWDAQISAHPKDPALLANAASFFQPSDPIASDQLFRRAITEDPSNPALLHRFAEFLTLQARLPLPALYFPNAAREALQIYEKLLHQQEAPTGSDAFYLLTDATEAAYLVKDYPAAHQYAEKLLTLAAQYKTDWNYGNAIYTANSILGLIALDANDIPTAEKHLLAAGATPGSPQLNSFGPDLTLAQKLLALDKRDTVLTYLDEIATFWKTNESEIKAWQKAIRDGQTPTFK